MVAAPGRYGYWPAQSEGDDLILYHPQSLESRQPEELMRFTFPRQKSTENLCCRPITLPRAIRKLMCRLSNRHRWPSRPASASKIARRRPLTPSVLPPRPGRPTAEATAEYLHRHVLQDWASAPSEANAIPGLSRHPGTQRPPKGFPVAAGRKGTGDVSDRCFSTGSRAIYRRHHPCHIPRQNTTA